MGNYIAKAYISFLTAEAMLPVIEKVHLIRGIVRECYEQESERTLGNSYRILMINPPNKDEDDEGFSIAYKEWLTLVGVEDFIDCNHFANGDEELAVKLFLELAEMTDTKISGSWTTFNERTILHKIVHEEEDIRRANYLLKTYEESGRATPLELAEAVRDGKIKL